MGTQLPRPKGAQSLSNFRPMSIVETAGWIKMPLGTEVGLGPCHIVLDVDPTAPPKKNGDTRAQQPPPQFSSHARVL